MTHNPSVNALHSAQLILRGFVLDELDAIIDAQTVMFIERKVEFLVLKPLLKKNKEQKSNNITNEILSR